MIIVPFQLQMVVVAVIPLVLLSSIGTQCYAFVPWNSFGSRISDGRHWGKMPHRHTVNFPRYMSGDGIAKDYRWHEETLELDIIVKVPKETTPKDIRFKVTANSLDLKLQLPNSGHTKTLLDPSRKLRGKVSVGGTYWMISDPKDSQDYREVIVTIEKKFRASRNSLDVIEYEWKGVYRDEDKDEVTFRQYDKPKKFDVREYAASLGVDIDNMNMSMVDKTMFTSGINNETVISQLMDVGAIKEVTRQGDGSEWVDDGQDGPVNFDSLGPSVSNQEKYRAETSEKLQGIDFPPGTPTHDEIRARTVKNTSNSFTADMREQGKDGRETFDLDCADPISTLSVARLRQILRERGLNETGNKEELQCRLRAEVETMLLGEDE